MTLAEYDEACLKAAAEYPEWRKGQRLFNVLWDLDADLANEVRGTEIDPFYDDGKCGLFCGWLFGRVMHGVTI